MEFSGFRTRSEARFPAPVVEFDRRDAFVRRKLSCRGSYAIALGSQSTLSMGSLPISLPLPRHWMRQRRRRRGLVQRPVRHPAAILPPRHLDGVGREVLAADVVVLAQLGAAQTREVAFGLVRARAVQGEGNRVVNAHHVVVGVQPVPAAGFVRVHDAAHGDALADQGDGIGLLAHDEGQRPPAFAALAGHDHDLTLAGLL